VLLVVGLGNPGPEYRLTRHNAGFLVVDRLAARHAGRWRRGLFANAEVARLNVGGRTVAACKPLTYMNLSGRAVGPLCRREGLGPGDVLLVYDDMDLPLGRLRVRPDGRAGGHRGVASVLQALGTEAVPRVRVGIGRPPDGVDAAQYVLAPVPPAERALWSEAVEGAVDAVEAVILGGLEAAMEKWNGRATL
jgi:PTH1 family peptidyl-tRNA hydrolase